MMDFDTNSVLIALLITSLAGLSTVLGSALVLFSKGPSPRMLSFGLAFAGGAMVYISLTEIFTKSVAEFTRDYGAENGLSYATFAFLAGMLIIILIDRLIPNPHEGLDMPDHTLSHQHTRHIQRIGLLTALAITAHNLPEGLATFFATLEDPTVGLPLATAIAIHNIPEGISIAAPVYFATRNKRLTVLACLISGIAEPAGALIGYALLANHLSPTIFGTMFGLIAGFMVFLALDELLPAAKRYAQGHETVYGLSSGMAVIATSLILI